jgi:hypothetical protein
VLEYLPSKCEALSSKSSTTKKKKSHLQDEHSVTAGDPQSSVLPGLRGLPE